MNLRLDCILVGNASLLVTCGEELRAAGARVALVVTEEPSIQTWARGLGVACEPYHDGLAGRLGPGVVDYLFSIGNLRVLRDDWLALARRMTINFHDALLPAYRGLHATSWALMHQEAEHGVTWHEAVSQVDAGDVLEQERFAVDPDETAFTLNAKCFEAGRRGFRRLIDNLGRDALAPRPVRVDGTSFFGRRRRPAAAGHVDWTRPLDQCDALVRALDFGPYPNPLCTPWSLSGGRVVRVDQATVAKLARPGQRATTRSQRQWRRGWASAMKPGARMRSSGCIAVATCSRCGWAPPAPRGDGTWCRSTCAGCRRWGRRGWPPRSRCGWHGRSINLPSISAVEATRSTRNWRGLEPWFETLPPFRVEVDLEQPFADCVTRVTAALDAHHGQATFLRDIVHRYPELKGGSEDGVAARLQAAITIGDDAAVARDGDAALVIHLSTDGSACEWRVDSRRVQAPIEVLQRQCAVFLRAAFSAPDVAAGRVPVIGPEERHRLLVEWNDTDRAITGPRTIPEQFEAQVARTPDAPAVATWRGGLSYRELNSRANRLARTLQARGVTPGSLVGLHLERSVDMVVALLGVLKAGAAYLPLDPAYPIERTRIGRRRFRRRCWSSPNPAWRRCCRPAWPVSRSIPLPPRSPPSPTPT